MTKHNKKRNVGIIYELLLRYISNCLIENNKKDLKKATTIIENSFAKGTELYKEFRLFNALAKTTASETYIAASIISEAKAAARKTNKKNLDKEKSNLIRDINYNLNDKMFYHRSVDHYRDYATIQTLLNEWRKGEDANIQKIVSFESKIIDHLLKTKTKPDLEKEYKKINESSSDKLVFKIMTEKLNKKYSNELSDDQKEIIKNYVFYGQKNDNTLKDYLTEKKNEAINLLENFSLEEDNKILLEKVDSVKKSILSVDVKNVNDNVVVKFLTVTKLINELTKTEE